MRIKFKVVIFIRIKLIRFVHFKLKMLTNTSSSGSEKTAPNRYTTGQNNMIYF